MDTPSDEPHASLPLPSSLQVYLFGTLSLERNGETLSLPDSSDARHLFSFLLLNKEKKHSRATLLGIFWSEASESRARKALSQAIWHIRRRFPDLIEVDHETIAISSRTSIWSDIENFKELAGNSANSHQDLKQAIQLYQGDLLEGIYEEWVLLEREHLRELYLQALERLIQFEKTEANYQYALELTLKLIENDSLRESAHREVMRLYYLLERPKAALRQYETCRQLLEDELGLEPESETTALAEEIARQSNREFAPHLPKSTPKTNAVDFDREHPISIALVGRENDRVALLQHVDNVFKGYGGMLLLDGEAGIGKTRLLQEIARDAEWRGAQVLWGHSQDVEVSPAFALLMNALNEGLSSLRVSQLSELIKPLWLEVLKPLIPKLGAHHPDLPAAPLLEPEQESARLAEAIITFVTSWGEITPLILLLEDLHWADEDTLRLLPAMANRLKGYAVLVIGTYRGEDARSSPITWKQLQILDRSGLLERRNLSGLDAASSSELIQRCLGLPQSAPTFEKRIYQETEGNPLFILETLRTLQDEGLLTQSQSGGWQTPWDDITADYAELPLPPVVEKLIARRLGQLSLSPRQVLNAATILGAEFNFSLLRAASEMKPKKLLKASRDLVMRHLLVETQDGYRFSHDKIRQVARGELDEKQRIGLHRRVLQTIEHQLPDQIEALAHHAARGELWKEAVEYHQRAALQAENTHAYAASLTHYDQALAFVDAAESSSSIRFDLLANREKILDILGKREEQIDVLEAMQALAKDDTKKLYQISLCKAKHLGQISQYAKSLSAARGALNLGKELKDKKKQSAALNILGATLILQGQTEDSLSPLKEAVELATESGNRKDEAQYRRSLASALLGIRDYETAKEELAKVLELAEEHDDLLEQAEVFNLLGIIQMERGESSEAEKSYEQSLKYCHEIGYLYGEGRALLNLGNLYYFQGQISKTLELYDQSIDVFGRLGEKRGEVQVRLNRASISINILGNKLQVKKDALFALDYAKEVDDPISKGQALTVLAEYERQSGEGEKARQHLEEGIKVMEVAGDRWLLTQEYRILGQLDIDEKKPAQALVNLERALEICIDLGMANMTPPIIALRGLALLQEERLDEALKATSEAMSHLKPDIEQVYLLPYWHAQVLAAMGRHDEEMLAIKQSYELLQDALAGISPEQRKISLKQVPEHRAIAEAWQRGQPRQIIVQLEKAGEKGEQVDVTWTVDTPEDAQIKGKVARRRQRLLRLLEEAQNQKGIPTHQNLADALGVGLRTIERDMATIHQK